MSDIYVLHTRYSSTCYKDDDDDDDDDDWCFTASLGHMVG